MTNDPDESAVIDLKVARRRIEERLAADGDLCRDDRAALAMFDRPFKGHVVRMRARRELERVLRNGVSYYTRTSAQDAGIAFVTAGEQVTNVIQLPMTANETRPMEATPPDAALARR